MKRIATELTPEELNQFDRDGFVMLGQVMSDAELEGVQRRIDQIMLGDVHYDGLTLQGFASSHEESARYRERSLRYRKIANLHLDDLFLAYFQKPLFRNFTRRFIGEDVGLQRDMLFNNYPHEGGIIFHQDGGESWNKDYQPVPFVTVWTALDPATVRNGCLRIVPGSHRQLIPLAKVNEFVSRGPVVPLEVAAGEAILLHNWTLHGSERNQSDDPRRAVTVCYADSYTRKSSGESWGFPRIFRAGALSQGAPKKTRQQDQGKVSMIEKT